MEGSKRTTTCFGHLCTSTKKIAKRQKNDKPYERKFVVKQYIKSLCVHCGSNPSEKPVASVTEMEL